jgi:hypothetical protein
LLRSIYTYSGRNGTGLFSLYIYCSYTAHYQFLDNGDTTHTERKRRGHKPKGFKSIGKDV